MISLAMDVDLDRDVPSYLPLEIEGEMECRQIPSGKSLPEMLVEGELAAAVNVTVDHPNVGPLIPEPDGAALEALRRDGLYPINHLVVVRDDLLEAHPGLAAEVFEAFAEAKNRYVRRLRKGYIQDPTAADRTYDRVMQVIGDPLPYGVEPNRPMIETLIRHAISRRSSGPGWRPTSSSRKRPAI